MTACSPARNLIISHESTQVLEQEEKAQELAQKVARATLDQIKGQLETDLARIRSQLPTKESRTRETALDVKYLKERQESFGLPMRGWFVSGVVLSCLGPLIVRSCNVVGLFWGGNIHICLCLVDC